MNLHALSRRMGHRAVPTQSAPRPVASSPASRSCARRSRSICTRRPPGSAPHRCTTYTAIPNNADGADLRHGLLGVGGRPTQPAQRTHGCRTAAAREEPARGLRHAELLGDERGREDGRRYRGQAAPPHPQAKTERGEAATGRGDCLFYTTLVTT
jgi:hypothetical protein